MKNIASKTPRIAMIADRLLDDIRAKRLKKGDPYLSLSEASRMLQVSASTANRALQLLSQRGILSRGQRRGTFIDNVDIDKHGNEIGHIYFLLDQTYMNQEGPTLDRLMVGIQGVIPGGQSRFVFLPYGNTRDFVDDFISEALKQRESVGVIMIRAPYEIQKAVNDSGLPAVVSGTAYPTLSNLASIDRDNRMIGRLLAEYLLDEGCRKICVLTREYMLPGDPIFQRSIRAVIAERGLSADTYDAHYLPEDKDIVKSETKTIIETSKKKIGILCSTEFKAQAAWEAIQEMSPGQRRKAKLAISHKQKKPDWDHSFKYTYPLLNPQEIGERIGELLSAQARNERIGELHEIVPVALI